jgi:hypothetical protein
MALIKQVDATRSIKEAQVANDTNLARVDVKSSEARRLLLVRQSKERKLRRAAHNKKSAAARKASDELAKSVASLAAQKEDHDAAVALLAADAELARVKVVREQTVAFGKLQTVEASLLLQHAQHSVAVGMRSSEVQGYWAQRKFLDARGASGAAAQLCETGTLCS